MYEYTVYALYTLLQLRFETHDIKFSFFSCYKSPKHVNSMSRCRSCLAKKVAHAQLRTLYTQMEKVWLEKGKYSITF